MRVSQARRMRRYYGRCAALFALIAIGLTFVSALVLSHPAIWIAMILAGLGALYMFVNCWDFAARMRNGEFRDDR